MTRTPPNVYLLPSKKYQAKLRIDGRYRSLGTFRTVKEAQQALARVQAGVDRPPSQDSETLAEYAERWMLRRQDKAPKTLQGNEMSLRLYVCADIPIGRRTLNLGDTQLDKITRPLVADWYAGAKLLASKRGRSGGHAAAAHAYRVLRAVLLEAERDDLIERSPARIKGAGAYRSEERQPPTPAEVSSLQDVMPPHLAVAVPLAFWGAMRRGEVLGLQRQDIDLSSAVIKIRRNLKTPQSRRDVHLPEQVMRLVEQHLDRYVGQHQSAELFPGAVSNFSRTWRRARAKVNMHHLHFHDLRHGGLTEAARLGFSVKALMARAGHTDPQMSLHYVHSASKDDLQIAQALEKLVP